MKASLGSVVALALVAALAACGDEPEDRADDPASEVRTTAGDPRVVTIVSGTAADGDVAAEATLIEDDRDLARYLEQFTSPSLAGDLQDAVDAVEPADDRVVGVAVIAIGCDVPPSATVTQDDGAFVVMPGKIVDPHYECFAPVTSVAVLDLPRAAG
ncbi:hypothetical protein [Nocardioides pelophilus]|uniref:hypothetical protein n=1 Tax=Nocardioides pelophilus TaxID=2172019 RepID=UPI001601C950|nr:hypothetical protein [Nocardioides pelophilus]